MATMEMDYNLKFSWTFQAVSVCLQKNWYYSRSYVSIHVLRLYLPLDVQKYCFSWVKLPTTDFRTAKAKNLWNPCDRAPLRLEINNGKSVVSNLHFIPGLQVAFYPSVQDTVCHLHFKLTNLLLFYFRRITKVPSEEMVSCFIRANTENPWRTDNSPWIVKVILNL